MKSTKSGLPLVYEDDLVTLYCGDGRSYMLGHAPTVEAIVTDPPYEDTALEWDRTVDGWVELAANLTSDLWCFGSMRFLLAHAPIFAASGWRYAQEVVWEKHNGSGFAADRFKRVHEFAVQWYRGEWAALHRDVPVTMDAKARKVTRRKQTPHTGEIGAGSVYEREDGGPRLMRSVIPCHAVRHGGVHPTQKPTGILRPLISYSCPPNGTVLDPFAGSGSTLLAARELGRKAIGVEINPDYCRAAAARLAQTELLVA